MLGTILFGVGVIAIVVYVFLGSAWIAGAAAALLVPAIIMLYQVGKSLR